jgi:hypothetical protein
MALNNGRPAIAPFPAAVRFPRLPPPLRTNPAHVVLCHAEATKLMHNKKSGQEFLFGNLHIVLHKIRIVAHNQVQQYRCLVILLRNEAEDLTVL